MSRWPNFTQVDTMLLESNHNHIYEIKSIVKLFGDKTQKN